MPRSPHPSSNGLLALLAAPWRGMREALDDVRGKRPRNPKALGRSGERFAARWLRKRGYRIAGRNVKGAGSAAGEADIVAIGPDRHTIVIVEVKTRERRHDAPPSMYPPEVALNHHKRTTLRALAHELARTNGWGDRPVQIDGLAIEFVTHDERVVERVVRHHERIA
jgi:putative endonuclease